MREPKNSKRCRTFAAPHGSAEPMKNTAARVGLVEDSFHKTFKTLVSLPTSCHLPLYCQSVRSTPTTIFE